VTQLHATPTTIREHNLSLVLNLIWEKKIISRAEIIRETHISAPTISKIANDLLESGFVREIGTGVSSGGRRPILLEFNPGVRYALGVDMGSSHISVVAMDLGGAIVAQEHHEWDVISDPEGTMELIRRTVRNVTRAAKLDFHDYLGLGFTVPTPLLSEQENRLMTYYMPAWEGYQPDLLMHQFLDIPVYLENDANAGAIAEKYWGCGRGYDNLVFIKLGIGVGCGMIINGSLFRGFGGSAGEIGHTTIEPKGRLCRCGNYGCMESYVGIPGIITGVREELQARGLSWPENTPMTIQNIVAGALNGDGYSRKVLQNAGNYLGIAVANLVNLVNPGLVVIGGDLVSAGDVLLDAVDASAGERIIPIESQMFKLAVSQLDSNAVAVGGATLVIHSAFQASNLHDTLKPILKGGGAAAHA
jgi:predicted NBD/HSP70 family sugar kinase